MQGSRKNGMAAVTCKRMAWQPLQMARQPQKWHGSRYKWQGSRYIITTINEWQGSCKNGMAAVTNGEAAAT